ncbi:hypothetical protein XFF6990_130170 [Xanthomonas citri pv. fuscans]|nr:hypothetical protein XFF6990_130170 [Xanthomonas citri pv. fuscans]
MGADVAAARSRRSLRAATADENGKQAPALITGRAQQLPGIDRQHADATVPVRCRVVARRRLTAYVSCPKPRNRLRRGSAGIRVKKQPKVS